MQSQVQLLNLSARCLALAESSHNERVVEQLLGFSEQLSHEAGTSAGNRFSAAPAARERLPCPGCDNAACRRSGCQGGPPERLAQGPTEKRGLSPGPSAFSRLLLIE